MMLVLYNAVHYLPPSQQERFLKSFLFPHFPTWSCSRPAVTYVWSSWNPVVRHLLCLLPRQCPKYCSVYLIMFVLVLLWLMSFTWRCVPSLPPGEPHTIPYTSIVPLIMTCTKNEVLLTVLTFVKWDNILDTEVYTVPHPLYTTCHTARFILSGPGGWLTSAVLSFTLFPPVFIPTSVVFPLVNMLLHVCLLFWLL